MSINHVHASTDINPEAAQHWWSQYMMDYSSSGRMISSPHKKFSLSSSSSSSSNSKSTNFIFNLNHSSNNTNEEDDDVILQEYSTVEEQITNGRRREIPKEPLFEKPLTPSDVGKLNRLVIPKQHAERCFPLNTDSGENGLLLSFEDVEATGKCWRFRYSYWNSSQSYVLTKGWSRFVKEKKLYAGDVVLFSRHRGRMFIGWRRGGGAARPSSAGGSVVAPNQTSTVFASGNSKRLRLFGVNLEYEPDNSDRSEPSGSPMSTSHGQDHRQTPYHQQQYYNYFYY